MDNQERYFKEAALIFSEELLRLHRGERLLIYIDQGSCPYTAKVIQESAQQIGALSELYELDSNLNLSDLVQELTHKVQDGAFDVICELSDRYFYQTSVWQRALQSGSRIYSLSGVNSDAFTRCIGKVNNKLMFQLGIALREILKKAKYIQIVTEKGTNIEVCFPINSTITSKIITS